MVSNTLSSCCFGVAVAVCLASVAAFPGMRPRGPMPAGYVNLTAAQKQAYLWAQVTADETSQPWFNTLEQAPIFLENMETTFEDKQDYPLPTGHKLYIHTVGWVAKFRYEAIPGNNTYTGAFEGAENGIMRFSFATEPSASDGIIPAAAWKFLRTGVLSANLFTMWGLAPQPSFNFFERVFTTHLPQDNVGGFLSKLVVEKFKTTTPCYLSVGTSPLSEYEESGAPEASPNFPFQVFLVPNPANAFADTFPQDWAASFAAIKPGTLLYEVHAISDPAATPVHIGNLYSDSDYVPSKFGDTQLFFEHARMSRDFDLRPQWKAAAYKDLCT